MNAKEFCAARASLGMTGVVLARTLRLGAGGDRTVRRWEAGDRPVSGPVEVAIELILACRSALAAAPRNGAAIIANAMTRIDNPPERAEIDEEEAA